MAGRRAGNHRGRKGKHGVYSAKHNDRNTKEQPEHIDPSKTPNNKIILYGRDDTEKITIEQHEIEMYNDYLREALERYNAKQIKNHHKTMTMDQARKNEKWCPEETYFTLGNAQQSQIDPEIFLAIHREIVEWQQKKYPQVVFLDSALHIDEDGAYHIHDRMIWLATETAEDGHTYNVVSQKMALEQMGVERPDPTKKTGRYNNAKTTFTADFRQKQIEISRAYGVEIIAEPRDPSKSGLSLEKYILQKIREDQEILTEQNDAISGEIAEKLGQIEYLDQMIADRQDQLAAYDANIADQQSQQIRHMELYKEMTQESAQYRDFMAQIKRNRENGGKER